MPLADRIRMLADRIESDLIAGHDYPMHTKRAWRMVQQLAAEGRSVHLGNLATGANPTGVHLTVLTQSYVTTYLAQSVFQHFVALLEDFVFGLLELWVLAHPEGIPRKDEKSVDFATILEAADKDELVRFVVDRELDGLKYKRPIAWFRYLNERVKLGGPAEEEVERLAEIKASRDILVHNRGVVNATYLDKAGPLARHPAGDRLEVEEPYLLERWALIRSVVADLSAAAIAKA